MSNFFWCKKCLNMSTRPRITFDENGNCNACSWSEEKKKINWKSREEELKKLLDKYRGKSKFDCIIPVSGGKDGTYVTDQLIKKYSIKPLCVTIKPPLELQIGKANLINFVESGVDHIHINPNFKTMSILDKIGFLHYGQGYYGWMTAVHSAPIIIASQMNVGLVFYGEDGEVEYGGTTKFKYNPVYGIEHQKKVFLNNTYEDVMKKSKLNENDLFWFSYADKNLNKINITHYSYFENWDPYRNYMLAKEKYNLQETDTTNSGTFTNFAHNDQALASLHYYLMYIKFGFGRATQDVGIEIRRGAISRDQAKNLVKLYDGSFPEEHLESYLKYFDLKEEIFFETIDKFANKELFSKTNKGWKPKFEIDKI